MDIIINKMSSYQCKRSVCKKADRPSIKTRIPMVRTPQNAKMIHKATPPSHPFTVNACRRTISHNTSANWAWANDKAHKRKYEAVCDTDPSTYSTVWIPEWIKISVISSSSWPCPACAISEWATPSLPKPPSASPLPTGWRSIGWCWKYDRKKNLLIEYLSI